MIKWKRLRKQLIRRAIKSKTCRFVLLSFVLMGCQKGHQNTTNQYRSKEDTGGTPPPSTQVFSIHPESEIANKHDLLVLIGHLFKSDREYFISQLLQAFYPEELKSKEWHYFVKSQRLERREEVQLVRFLDEIVAKILSSRITEYIDSVRPNVRGMCNVFATEEKNDSDRDLGIKSFFNVPSSITNWGFIAKAIPGFRSGNYVVERTSAREYLFDLDFECRQVQLDTDEGQESFLRVTMSDFELTEISGDPATAQKYVVQLVENLEINRNSFVKVKQSDKEYQNHQPTTVIPLHDLAPESTPIILSYKKIP